MKKKGKAVKIILLSALAIVLAAGAALIVKEYSMTKKTSFYVYFIKNLGGVSYKLEALERKIPVDRDNKIQIAVKNLLDGPTKKEKKQGYYTEIPISTKLIGVEKTEKDVVINLSKDFESGGGSTSMIMRLKQLTNTCLDAEKELPVYLEIEGKRATTIGGEGLMVPQPLSVSPNGGKQ